LTLPAGADENYSGLVKYSRSWPVRKTGGLIPDRGKDSVSTLTSTRSLGPTWPPIAWLPGIYSCDKEVGT